MMMWNETLLLVRTLPTNCVTMSSGDQSRFMQGIPQEITNSKVRQDQARDVRSACMV